MKILLVNPPYRIYYTTKTQLFLPRNLAILAACLIKSGVAENDISILDLPIEIYSKKNIPEELPSLDDSLELLEFKIKEFNPDIIGIGIHAAPFIPDVSECVKTIKKLKKDATIITGGIIPSIFKEKIFDIIPGIDFAFDGDAEQSIVEFVKNYNHNISSKHKIISPANGANKSLTYPLPAYHLLRLDLYDKYYSSALEFEERFAPHLEVIRGCPYQCDFCGVERSVRIRDIESIIEEIEFLSKNGYKKIYFCDETFTLFPNLTEKLCNEIIHHNFDIKWRCVTRSDLICKKPELVKIMKEAGCYEVGLGIEVGSQEILDKMKKGLKLDHQIEATKLLQSNGINVNALVILCNPRETHEDIRRTFEFVIKQLKPNTSQVFIFHPVPSTTYFDSGKWFEINVKSNKMEDWYKWDHTGEPVSGTINFSREDIIKYYFAYNHALPTVIDNQQNDEFLTRFLNLKNIFPRKNQDVVFFWDGKDAFFYNPSYPEGIYDGNIYLNSRKLSSLKNEMFPDYVGENSLEEISDRLFYEILLHCNGDFTIQEINDMVMRFFSLDANVAKQIVEMVLGIFKELNIIQKLNE